MKELPAVVNFVRYWHATRSRLFHIHKETMIEWKTIRYGTLWRCYANGASVGSEGRRERALSFSLVGRRRSTCHASALRPRYNLYTHFCVVLDVSERPQRNFCCYANENVWTLLVYPRKASKTTKKNEFPSNFAFARIQTRKPFHHHFSSFLRFPG